MERELYREASAVLAQLPHLSSRRCVYDDRRIVEVLLWAAVHDRPICWACQARHWPLWLRGRPLPSQSQMSRRLRRLSVRHLLQRLYGQLRDRLPRSLLQYIDGKPLVVGGCSKDPDAKFGRAAGCIGRGYKLVCLVDEHGAVEAWNMASMNVPEHVQAEALLGQVAEGQCVVADSAYDKNALYERAGRRGVQWVAARKRRAKGLGHRRHSAYRLAAIQQMAQASGQALLRGRTAIERSYGHLTSFAGGLAPLPAWVRRPHRVAVWVQAKLILDAVRRIRLQNRRQTG